MLDSMIYFLDGIAIKDFGKISRRNSVEFVSISSLVIGVISLISHYLDIRIKREPYQDNQYTVDVGGVIEDLNGLNWPLFFNDDDEALLDALGKCELIGFQEKPVPIPVVGLTPISALFKKANKEIPEELLLSKLPSSELYSEAEDELWIIGTTFSEALRKDSTGLDKVCKALIENPKLQVHIAFAEFNDRLYSIARDEIGAIYSAGGGRAVGFTPEHIQTLLISNRYESRSIEKFLYPAHLDYLGKLNDLYAAITHLYLTAKEHGVNTRIRCHTYTGPPSLRATIIKGKKREILDFLHTYEGHIGMTGNLFRVDGIGEDKDIIWDKAQKELKYGIGLDGNGMDSREAAHEISNVFKFKLDREVKDYLVVPDKYFEPDNITGDFLSKEWNKFDIGIQKYCNEEGYGINQKEKEEARMKRRDFLDLKNDIVRNRVEGELKGVIAFHNTN